MHVAAVGLKTGQQMELSEKTILKIGEYRSIERARYFFSQYQDLQELAERKGFDTYTLLELTAKNANRA